MRWLLALTLLLAAVLARAQDLLPVPPLTARVIDQTATLTEPQRAALEAKLAAFEAEAGPQIVVLMVPTTAPEDIADFTQRVGDEWKIGRREVGDGVLVIVAKDQRRVRISPAKALEGAIPDLAARQIIDRQIGPAFREGDYARGLDAAVDALIARIRGEELPAPARESRSGRSGGGLDIEQLLMFFFVGVTVVSSVMTAVFGRKLGALLTGGAAGGVAWWITASVLVGVGVGIAALVLIGIFGIGAAARRMGGGRDLPHIGGWGGGYGAGRGGWSGGRGGGGFGGGGGFRSGGGGNFGGGGASGGW
ncbi:MAG: TPM domain-containing protein [Rubrivivax sp.]|nr:TPM domain-containing protein [Rubrivivax sp.]